MSMKLIILDRDGVINKDSDAYIKSPDEFIPLPGSLQAIARLKQAGYTIAVATNQSGIARGYFDETSLAAMHEKLAHLLDEKGGGVDYIAYCPHGPDDNCTCRKPLPGLLYEIRDHFKTDLTDVPMIGDSLRDIQAARTVGGYPILVRTGKGENTLAKASDELTDVPVYMNLAAAVDALLNTVN
jgi:D-glycero-D-manno-heptose 1,7-bisphosphate phosphatase